MPERETKSPNPNAGGFRSDINGLRAWAVGLVLLYHFEVPGFSGGFVGVDVFFVISGFLMASIIVGGLERGTFSWSGFLLSRMWRILPALAAMAGFLLLLGWFYLSAFEYAELAQQALSSLTFASNFQFWLESGYFDSASHDKWLLHTWSLSVEAQFYACFPIVLVWCWSVAPKHARVRTGLSMLAAGSLAFCILQSTWEPSAAFYLLPSRTWELLTGALVCVWQWGTAWTGRQRTMAGLLGFACLITSAVCMDTSIHWPGAWAVVPVAGAALILSANRADSMLTASPIAQWLGSRSYSIYLWHWPVVVLLGYLQLQTNVLAGALGVGSTLLIAHLSYEFVERPRMGMVGVGTPPVTWQLLAGIMLLVVVPAAIVVGRGGVPGRVSPQADIAALESKNRFTKPLRCDARTDSPGSSCIYGGSKIDAILVGDSHAQSVASALAAARADPESGVLVWIYPSCITIFTAKMTPGVFRSGLRCPEFNQWVLKSLEQYSADIPIVLVSRTSTYAFGYTERVDNASLAPGVYFTRQYSTPLPEFIEQFSAELVDSICRLARTRKVYVLRPIPEMGVDVPRAVARAIAMGASRFPSISMQQYTQRHLPVLQAEQEAKRRCGAVILDPLPYLCPNEQCLGVMHGRPIYYDDDHLSEYGNKFLVPMFRAVFDRDEASASRQ